MALLTQSAFAKIAGVSRPAIIKALKTGNLIKDASKKIDDQHPKSIRYLRIQLEKSKDNLVKETAKKKVSKVKAKSAKKQPAPKQSKKPKTKEPSPPAEPFDPDVGADIIFEKDQIEAEYKRVQTEKIKIANAEKLKLLVPADFVKKKFGKLSATILNYFFPVGERLAPIICGICKVTDPKIIKKVEIEISNEITRGLCEFKKVASEEMKE